jgi:hypothetical protein
MPQIATWTERGLDHAGSRRTDTTFRRTAEEMARTYEQAKGLAADTVVFTIRDADDLDPRTTTIDRRVQDAAPPDLRTQDEKDVDAIIDKGRANWTTDEQRQVTEFTVKELRGRA